jgi:hypothetical protein
MSVFLSSGAAAPKRKSKRKTKSKKLTEEES